MLGKNKFNKKAVTLLVCIITSFVLWVYVSYVENPDMTRWITNIPVTVTGEAKLNENSLAVKSLSDTRIDLKIRAKRNLFTELSSDTIKATIDVSSITQAGENNMTVSLSFLSSSSGITIADRRNADIIVTVEEYITKTFPIEPVVSKTPSGGYFVNSVQLSEGDMQLSVSGCVSDIERIHHISTNNIDLSHATDDVVVPVIFTPVDESNKAVSNIDLALEGADMAFEIYKEAAVPLIINVLADDDGITYELNPTAVYVEGPASTIDNMEPIRVADVNEFYYNADDTITRTIYLPYGVTLREGELSTVEIKFTHAQ